MKPFIILIFSLVFSSALFAQELNCMVQIDNSQIQSSNIQVFNSLQASITEFMNTTKWTDHIFSNKERIDCSISIILSDFDGVSKFTGTLQVISRRPIYGTNIYTTMLDFKESNNGFIFEQMEGQPLIYSENSVSSNLAAVLSFYAYIILGYDYDSFKMEDGTQFFQKAQNIVTMAQSSSSINDRAWQSYETNGRYNLVEQILNESMKPMRRANYRYHRLGLDKMAEQLESGRREISESFKLVNQAYNNRPNSIIIQLFANAKSDEIIKIFKDATVPDAQKVEVYNIMVKIDPTNTEDYEAIKLQ